MRPWSFSPRSVCQKNLLGFVTIHYRCPVLIFLSWPLASQRASSLQNKNPGADVHRAGVSSFVGVSTNTASDDSRAVDSRNSRNRADSHSRNSAVDSHSRNMAVDSHSSHGDSNRLFQWLCGSSPELRGFPHHSLLPPLPSRRANRPKGASP